MESVGQQRAQIINPLGRSAGYSASRVWSLHKETPARVSGSGTNFLLNRPASQPYGLVDALDGDDSIGVLNEPNEGPYFGSRIFPSIGLPTADGARVLKIIQIDRKSIKTHEPRAGQCKRAQKPATLRDGLGISNEVRPSRTNGWCRSIVGRLGNWRDN